MHTVCSQPRSDADQENAKHVVGSFLSKSSAFLGKGELVRISDDYPPPRERVFANHTIQLKNIDFYGFDFDYRYHRLGSFSTFALLLAE